LTANPINPITKNPTATALEISRNSRLTSSHSENGIEEVQVGTSFTWFRASIQEECAISDKVARNIKKFFNLVRHTQEHKNVDSKTQIFNPTQKIGLQF
jgi:hypothetical protein